MLSAAHAHRIYILFESLFTAPPADSYVKVDNVRITERTSRSGWTRHDRRRSHWHQSREWVAVVDQTVHGERSLSSGRVASCEHIEQACIEQEVAQSRAEQLGLRCSDSALDIVRDSDVNCRIERLVGV